MLKALWSSIGLGAMMVAPCIAVAAERVAVVGVAQLGPDNSAYEQVQRNTANLRALVQELPRLETPPELVVFAGDLMVAPTEEVYVTAEQILSELSIPVAALRGRIEGQRANPRFQQFQQRIGAPVGDQWVIDLATLSVIGFPAYDAARVGLPARLRWLREQLEAKADRDVIVIVGSPLLSVGLSSLDLDLPPLAFRRDLLDLINAFDNVSQVLAGGHTIGIKAAEDSRWALGASDYTTLPALTRVTASGDEHPAVRSQLPEFNHGYYTLIDRTDGDMTVSARQIGQDPEAGFVFEAAVRRIADDPRQLARLADVEPAGATFDGDFEAGVGEIHQSFRLRSGLRSTTGVSVTGNTAASGEASLEMRVLSAGRAQRTDESVDVYQVFDVSEMSAPTVQVSYRISSAGRTHFGGSYIRVAAYAASERRFEAIAHTGAREAMALHTARQFWQADDGIAPADLAPLQAAASAGELVSFRVPDQQGRWHTISLNLKQLVAHFMATELATLDIDRVSVMLGVWTGKDRLASGAANFDNLQIRDDDAPSRFNERPLVLSERNKQLPYGTWSLDGYRY